MQPRHFLRKNQVKSEFESEKKKSPFSLLNRIDKSQPLCMDRVPVECADLFLEMCFALQAQTGSCVVFSGAFFYAADSRNSLYRKEPPR